jgi:TatD DNase family protein
MLAIRKKSDQSIPWIFHWFNSDESIAYELIRKNCFLSFGHMLFKEKSKAFRAFRKVPEDQLFLETDDAGYSIQEIYSMAASLRNCDLNGLRNQIIHNFDRCFRL